MSRLHNIFLVVLILGLIGTEVFSSQLFPKNSAQSQHQLTATEQNAILNILQHGLANKSADPTTSQSSFPSLSNPQNPGEVAGDAIAASGLINQPSQNSNVSSYSPAEGFIDSSTLLQDALPPAGTPLDYAYRSGGRFWYGQGINILVTMPDGSINSFNKQTGAGTSWLQDRLAFPPVSDPSAYANYQKNYHAAVVADGGTWVLMEFPSGAVIKVAKPTTQSPPATSSATPNIYGLPSNY